MSYAFVKLQVKKKKYLSGIIGKNTNWTFKAFITIWKGK